MKPFTVKAHIHSLDGELREITVLKEEGNAYVVKFGEVTCSAFFNPITCEYYADDKYGIIGGSKK